MGNLKKYFKDKFSDRKGLAFSVSSCLLMASTMTAYNIILHNGFNNFFTEFFFGLLSGILVALFLSIFVVSPIAKKITFSLPILDKNKKLHIVLSISICMIVGMVICMSFYSTITTIGLSSGFLLTLITIIGQNMIVAAPLQLLLVGPFLRKVFKR